MAQMVHIKKRNSYTAYTDIKIKELKAIKKEARARGSGLSISQFLLITLASKID